MNYLLEFINEIRQIEGNSLIAVFEAIARLLTSPFGGIGISSIIFFSALFTYLFGFSRYTRPIILNLTEANSKLNNYDDQDAFTNGYEEFNQWMQQNEILKDSWRVFSDTFIFSAPNEDRQLIRASQEASIYFNDQTLLYPRLNVNFYNSFPNYLTGAGILGTFIGLFCGIYLSNEGFVSKNIQEVIKALQSLLGGASLAFITSIVGISCSIIFSWREKKRTHKINKLISNWNFLINELVPIASLERLSDSILVEAKKQTTQLQRFNTDLAVSIAAALDEKLTQRLGPVLNQLIESVDRLRDARSEIDKEFLENIVENFKNSLSDTINSDVETISETLKKVDETLKATVQKIETGQDEIQQSTQNITNNFEQSVAGLIQSTDQIQQLVSNLGESLNEMGIFLTSFREVNENFRGIISPLHETSENLRNGTNQIREATQNTSAFMDVMTNLGTQLEESSRALSDSWEEYRGRFEGIDESTRRLFQEINTGLERYTDQIRSFVVDLENRMAQAVGDLGGAIGELSVILEDLDFENRE